MFYYIVVKVYNYVFCRCLLLVNKIKMDICEADQEVDLNAASHLVSYSIVDFLGQEKRASERKVCRPIDGTAD